MDYLEKAVIFKALGDETRQKIVAMLSKGSLCACKILEEFKITQPTLSHHMKVLCDAKLVTFIKDGKWMHYSLNKDLLSQLAFNIEEMCQNKETITTDDCQCKNK
ncbi:MAG: metalloregulator ArsR/SmtB family transcription factor [Bacilli bacterium]|nr:metalloregulator ArsR/SmtB family transcription factor [Bacilli bacterium]